MPIEISCTVKNASALQTRMSQAVARSRAPPMQPPWIAQMAGNCASSRALKQSISFLSDSWKASRSRAVVAEPAHDVAHGGEERRRHRVHSLGPVQLQVGDAVVVREFEEFGAIDHG